MEFSATADAAGLEPAIRSPLRRSREFGRFGQTGVEEPGVPCAVALTHCQENGMAKQNRDFNQQQQQSKPPRVDELAKEKQKAEEEEVAGRHKNDGKDDHKGNRR
jgi:hypothetical protein